MPVAPLAVLAVGVLALSACSVSEVMRPDVDVGAKTSAVPARGLARLVPSNPFMAGFPRFNSPASPLQTMSAEERQCRTALKRLGVTYRDIAPINDSASCRIDHPVEISGFSGNIALKPAATLNCQMALAFARWTKDELAPAARWRYMSGIRTIHQGSSYSCRRVNGTTKMSEHSRGNALDVMQIDLKNGKKIDVRKPGWFSFRERGLLNTVRSDACSYFTTVLGPGYDRDHADHFHFDIKPRRNGYRACK